MGFRTVSLADDAYESLSAIRRPGESFSDVVRRLAPRRSLLELFGLLTKAEGDALAEAIEANRRDRLRARRARLGLK
jgi:predicted CopG family antitoxin